MEVEGKGLSVIPGSAIDATTCSAPGCNHIARSEVTPEPTQAGAVLCACCRRRVLEQRLAALQVEIDLLPHRIAGLPRHCQHETRPDYENVST